MLLRLIVSLLAVVAAVSCGRDAGSRDGGPPPLDPAQLNPAIGPQSAAALADPRARIFLTKGCPQCHALSAYQVTSPSNQGPDLTVAATDVRSRFNTSLDSFMRQPTGTMQIVLSSMITLTPAERDSIVKLLIQLNSPQHTTGP